MPACPQCQSTVSVNDRFCHNCGSPILSRMARRQNKINTSLYGIGGWLILVAIGLISSIIVIFTACLDYYIEELYVQAVIHVILVIYGIICLLHLLRHSPAFPLLFTIYACAGTAAGLILQTRDFIASGQWLSISPLLSSLPLTILWIIYMRRSKRVKNTFERTSATPQTASSINEPSGIGGWMILAAVGLFGITGMFLLQVISSLNYLDFIALAIYLILFTYGVFCIVLMFKRTRLFPKFYIGLLSTNIVLNLLLILRLFWLGIDASSVLSELYGPFVGAMIWITYMLTSKRVKNTFVR